MTDWLAQISGVGSALAGLDMAMPGDVNEIPLLGNSYWMYDYSRSILNGSIPVDRMNDAVTRILATYFKMGQDSPTYPRPNFDTNTQDAEGPLYPGALFSPRGVVNEFVDVQANHAEVAREVARDAITLLKNDDGILPLTTNGTLKVFGTDAEKNSDGINSCADQGCNKGTLGMVSEYRMRYPSVLHRSRLLQLALSGDGIKLMLTRAGEAARRDTPTWIHRSMVSNHAAPTFSFSTKTRSLPTLTHHPTIPQLSLSAQTRERTILRLRETPVTGPLLT
jgi:beta-glucosidase-like glycosyl hydrolase